MLDASGHEARHDRDEPGPYECDVKGLVVRLPSHSPTPGPRRTERIGAMAVWPAVIMALPLIGGPPSAMHRT
jgi:hypothetical protein